MHKCCYIHVFHPKQRANEIVENYKKVWRPSRNRVERRNNCIYILICTSSGNAYAYKLYLNCWCWERSCWDCEQLTLAKKWSKLKAGWARKFVGGTWLCFWWGTWLHRMTVKTLCIAAALSSPGISPYDAMASDGMMVVQHLCRKTKVYMKLGVNDSAEGSCISLPWRSCFCCRVWPSLFRCTREKSKYKG